MEMRNSQEHVREPSTSPVPGAEVPGAPPVEPEPPPEEEPETPEPPVREPDEEPVPARSGGPARSISTAGGSGPRRRGPGESLTLVGADQLCCGQGVALEGALELALAGAGPQFGVGVEGVEPEGVAVAAVAGGRAGPPVAARAEVVAPLDWGGLAFGESLGPGSSAQPSQWVKVRAAASGSSITSASERVPPGAPDHESGGERSSPSQLCRRGIAPPCSNALL
jgi:hypothetical protein